jgi:hypothetical protein
VIHSIQHVPPVKFCSKHDRPVGGWEIWRRIDCPLRLRSLLKLCEAREFAWLADFFPWVLTNGGMLHKNAAVLDRVSWFLMAYCCLMTCLDTYETSELGPGMSPFRQKKGTTMTRRTLFDQKLLVHATNSIAGILYEIRNASVGTKISLRRISTVPVGKKFGVTRMHARGTKLFP